MPCGDKRSKKENKTHKRSGKNLIGFPQGAPWGPRAGVERAAAQPGAQEHTKAAATWHMGARPGTDRDAGSAGPLPPDSLFKAVRGRERPAAVEQARSAAVDFIPTQAALPRPAPKLGLILPENAFFSFIILFCLFVSLFKSTPQNLDAIWFGFH